MRTDLAEELRLWLRGWVRRHDVHGGAATSATGFLPEQVMAIALDPRCEDVLRLSRKRAQRRMGCGDAGRSRHTMKRDQQHQN